MKFVFGFLAGVVVGAAGAVAYSVQTGRDLREAFDEVRSDLNNRDFDALGARIEARVAEMQAQLEARMATVRERAAQVSDTMSEAAPSTETPTSDAVSEATEAIEAAVEEAADRVE